MKKFKESLSILPKFGKSIADCSSNRHILLQALPGWLHLGLGH